MNDLIDLSPRLRMTVAMTDLLLPGVWRASKRHRYSSERKNQARAAGVTVQLPAGTLSYPDRLEANRPHRRQSMQGG
jgi:hypothetical protein